VPDISAMQIDSHYLGRQIYPAYLHNICSKAGMLNYLCLATVAKHQKTPGASIFSTGDWAETDKFEKKTFFT